MTAIPADARALTIRQPWASLIALGVKTIETRGWRTDYRGPLVIHAGKRRAEHGWVGEWVVGPAWTSARPPLDGMSHQPDSMMRVPLPLGAVVAVVDLVDVVPIIDGSLGWTEDSDTPPAAVVVSWRRTAMLVDTREIGPFPDLDDQEPYGDFTPGRYAWLLDNVRPVDPPIPAKGRQGLWRWSS